MSAPSPRRRFPGEAPPWLPALAYLVLGGIWAWNYRFHLNSDAVVYLDIARLFAGGRFPDAFVGYWGPLFPALTGALHALGVPLVAAGKGVAFLSGLAFVLAVQGLLRTRLSPRRAAAGTLWSAVPATLLVGTPFSVLPDALLGTVAAADVALLLAYARRPSAGKALGAGLLCGLAYLCKSPAWILFVPSTAAVLGWTAWLRRRRDGGLRPGRLAGHAALAAAGLLLVMLPWMAGLHAHGGRWGVGSASDYILVHNYRKLGFSGPFTPRWMETGGRRWLVHNPWTMEVRGAIPFHVGYYLRRMGENPAILLPFLAACPVFLAGAGALLFRFRRSLSTPRAAALVFCAAPLIALATRSLELRWLLYFTPALALAGAAAPVPRWMRSRPPLRRAALVAAVALLLLVLGRNFPRIPLGTARWEACQRLRPHFEGGGRAWYNRMAAGMPVAFLLDLDVSDGSPYEGKRPGRDDPDVLIWTRIPGEPTTDWPPADWFPEYEPVSSWQEEDGIGLRVYRRR